MLVTITNEEAQALSDRRKRNRNRYRTGMLSSRPDAHAIKVLIVEVGYSSELRYKERLQATLDQHKQLMQALENAGHQCKLLPVVLGTTGGVFNSNLSYMTTAGVSYEWSTAILRQLSTHGIDYMQTIIDLMRRLEKLNPP